MPLTDEQLAEIKRLDAERTPGTWYVERPNTAGFIRLMRPGREAGDTGIAQMIYADWWFADGTPNPTNGEHERNAEFAAAASWAIPALIAEVERYQARERTMREWVIAYRENPIWNANALGRIGDILLSDELPGIDPATPDIDPATAVKGED